MRHLLPALALVLAATTTATTATTTAPATAATAEVARAAAPTWRGDSRALPSAYAWLDEDTPLDTYSIAIVRGLGPRAVLKRLGTVRTPLGRLSPRRAAEYQFDRTSDVDYVGPLVAQVQRLGRAVVVYLPTGILDDARLAAMSRGGTAVSFFTDVELDTYVTVASKGRVVRQFDAFFPPPTKGALPAETGLDWGQPDQNVFATAWAFGERISRTHISQEWFESPHPTWEMRESAF